MKKLGRLAMLTLTFMAPVAAQAYVTINMDTFGCMYSSHFVQTQVEINAEEFEFTPWCDFPFEASFKTRTGLSCEVAAGMCSPAQPFNRFEVSCSDGSHESQFIQCRHF